MNESERVREFDQPYQGIAKAKATGGHLKPTSVKVPPFSTFAVPFTGCFGKARTHLDECSRQSFPPDEESPFDSAWVFSRHRPEALCETFFGRLSPGDSLVFFYSRIAGLL